MSDTEDTTEDTLTPPAPEDTTAEDTGDTAEDDPQTLRADNERLRAEVNRLKDENAKRRIAAQDADELRQRLHTELVRATGRLADPSDLAYAEEHLSDSEALATAVDELLQAKPHLASRTPKGDVGQGNRGSAEEPTSWLSVLKNFA